MNEYQYSISGKRIYTPSELTELLNEFYSHPEETEKNNKGVAYHNIPCCFDIETSSFYDGEEKRCLMYEWTLNINGGVMIGRKWEEFTNVIDELCEILNLNEKNRLIIYVHNLSYEFQFFRKLFTWLNVFAVDTRKPVYCTTTDGIEFRCSYILSGYSLEVLGRNLNTYKCRKLQGDLDYDKIRHYDTSLTEEEAAYCVNDTKVVVCYIQELIDKYGDLTAIPLTKTGFVRDYCREKCFYEEGKPRKNSYKKKNYNEYMNSLRLDENTYNQLKRAFQGGFTHASAYFSRKIIENVRSLDFTSSYPTVMISEKFPCTSFTEKIVENEDELMKKIRYYACMFDVEFIDIQPKLWYDHPISISKCRRVQNPIVDNGRLVQADRIIITLVDVDFLTVREYYSWKSCKILLFRQAFKDYLPKDLIESILDLYVAKTTLKGVAGKENEYLNKKEMLNSIYGASVTDICRVENIYTEDWFVKMPNIGKMLQKYNGSKSRFLYYPWGVWVTAYARRNLFSGITECGTDYIYSDTDSVKIRNYENHKKYFEKYNSQITKKLKIACDKLDIDFEKTHPKTIYGVEKPLGVWDDEGEYSRFKALGAKRYITEKDGEISLTVSGLNKKFAIPYLLNKYGKENIFTVFDDDLYLPPSATGKKTHTYIDNCMEGNVTDYLGNTVKYKSPSGIHLEPCDFTLSMALQYIDFLRSY